MTCSRPAFIFGVLLSLLILTASPAGAVVSTDHVLNLADRCDSLYKDFMDATRTVRLSFDYADSFCAPEDRDLLAAEVGKAVEAMQPLAQQQAEALRDIEAYEGPDWDALYGQTGLWRRLSQDLEKTRLLAEDLNYYQSLAQNENPGRIHPVYLGRIAWLAERQNLNPAWDFERRILELKTAGEIDWSRLAELKRDLQESPLCDHAELNLRIAYLYLKSGGDASLLEKAVTQRPGLSPAAARALWMHIRTLVRQGRWEPVAMMPAFAVELSGLALADEPDLSEYAALLEGLVKYERFQVSILYMLCGEAIRDQSPLQAMEYYLRAAAAMRRQPGELLYIPPEKIAREAARTGLELYFTGQVESCEMPEKAVRYYLKLAPSPDPEIDYLFVQLLQRCGQESEALERLQALAKSGHGWSVAARLDLISAALEQSAPQSTAYRQAISMLKTLISVPSDADEVTRRTAERARALACDYLLTENSLQAAEEALYLLKDAPESIENTLRQARAHYILTEFDASAGRMAALLKADDAQIESCVNTIDDLVLSIVDRIELCLESLDSDSAFIADMTAVLDRLGGLRRGRLAAYKLAHAEVLLAGRRTPSATAVTKAQAILSAMRDRPEAQTLRWARTMARLEMVRGEYGKAARHWVDIANARAVETESSTRNDFWWRAKYYQILCFSRMQGVQQVEVKRAIEVLEAGFTDIPSFWHYKIRQIAQP